MRFDASEKPRSNCTATKHALADFARTRHTTMQERRKGTFALCHLRTSLPLCGPGTSEGEQLQIVATRAAMHFKIILFP
jgi:hypothetical protein